MPEKISSVTIEDKMRSAYLNYSLSVIVARALPDVRDGLKPVHRRILYAARELNLSADKPHKKSARVVGEVLGKYHPHGDAAVYDAMVRMAQDFNQRYRLLDGHGNFGSIDGDSPAAMRYTEVRLTPLAEELLTDIKEETVDFKDNFDGSLQEPVILPTRIPNLLVNGSSGIAVGMSTDIPPHNLGEVIDALLYLLKHPQAPIETLLKYIPGPDFPTGGQIIGSSGIYEAYKTGKGKIILRAKTSIEKVGRKTQIVITEIPYQLNKSRLLEEIAEMVQKNRIENIADLRDESDREGLRIVVELKNAADPELVLNRLYKYTSLQSSYRINLLALNGKKPEVMNLISILQHFIDFRRQVISRRTKFRLNKAKQRYHILQGLIKATAKLDLVISIIRNAASTKEASQLLQEQLEISPEQAKAILEMQLQRLVGMEIEKLHRESGDLAAQIEEYQAILNQQDILDQVLRAELLDVKKRFNDPRRTEIIPQEEEAKISRADLIQEKEAVISLSYRQNIKRTDNIESLRAGKNDFIINYTRGTSLDTLLFFTAQGEVYTLPVHRIPEHHGLSTGDHLKEFLKLPLKEKIIKVICLNEANKQKYITIATAQGMVKKTLGAEYETNYSNIKAIKLNPGDEVIGVAVTDNRQEILLATKEGQTIRFREDSINATGRNTLGNKGIKLAKNDRVISLNIVDDDELVVAITSRGKAKSSALAEYKVQSRNGKGLKTYGSNIHQLAGLYTAKKDDYLLLITNNENLYPVKVSDISVSSRSGNMYSLLKLTNDTKVVAVYKLPIKPEEAT